MASYYPSSSAAAARPVSFHPAAAAPLPVHNAPPGTFAPGTKVLCGNHRATIERYLSEGGFAHVYIVRVPTSSGGHEIAVLKRVAVPDKDALANMRTEVETMKKLKGHNKIVTYIDSHASQMKGGGYEVFLLMEFCEGGGLIDFMNTRLKDRLREPEILKIFSDTAEGVACMHYLKPPLLHRDLKVENILISTSGGQKIFKLCDFGSTAPPRPAATNAAEGKLIEDDVQKHTTMQYRSPEMVDVYRRQPIDEKSDIWALGVLLYKLCYYTTPFEAQGQMAILTASFKYPAYPQFSDRMKMLIAVMLSENPQKRPNIYQVLKEVCAMRGKEVPIKDIYSKRTQSEARSTQRLPSPEPNIKSPPPVAAVQEIPVREPEAIPEITPMRRGRPPAAQKTPATVTRETTTSATDKDPFAALDSADIRVRAAAADKLAARFPAVDDFSILQGKGGKFEFGKASPQTPATKRETEAMADKTFQNLTKPDKPTSSSSSLGRSNTVAGPPKPRAKPDSTSKPLPELPSKSATQRSDTASTGTIKSLPPSSVKKPPPVSDRPIWRVPTPSGDRYSTSEAPTPKTTGNKPETLASRTASRHNLRPVPLSSRPSLESFRTPSFEQGAAIERARSADVPAASMKSRIKDFENGVIRADESGDDEPETGNDESMLDYLREEEQAQHRHHLSLKRLKHASMPASLLSGTKPNFSGRLGHALRHFESHDDDHNEQVDADATLPAISPQPQLVDAEPDLLEENAVDDAEELSPETRREQERRRLSAEEKRVSQAAAEYRQRTQAEGAAPSRQAAGTVRKVSAIQDRVKNFLQESERSSSVRKTASGYGHYTEKEDRARLEDREPNAAPPNRQASFEVGDDSKYIQSKPVAPRPVAPVNRMPAVSSGPAPADSQQVAPSRAKTTARPTAPPKKAHLRTATGSLATPVPVDPPTEAPATSEDLIEFSTTTEDLESELDFEKRFPSLPTMEAEIVTDSRGFAKAPGLRIRDV